MNSSAMRKQKQPQKQPQNNPAASQSEEKGWRDVLVWIIPVTIACVLTVIGITYSSHKLIALWSTASATILTLYYLLFLAEWYTWTQNPARKRARIVFACACLMILGCTAVFHYKLAAQPEKIALSKAEPAPTTISTVAPERQIITPSKKSPLTRTATPEPEPTIHPDVKAIGYVTGYVYDGETRKPLQGAVIVAQNDTTRRKYQGAVDGQSILSIAVEAGAYTVTASREGYLEVTQFCYARHDTPCTVYVYLQKKP
jgi:hypothetical protein